LRSRFFALIRDEQRMQKELGPDYLQDMKRIRDIRFEFTRMRVEGQYLGMALTDNIFKRLGLGGDSLLDKLRRFNDWMITDLPVIADKIGATLTPVLKEVRILLGD
jgi:hypothetical protein